MVVGALDYRLDLDALEILADSDPSWHVVLVGPVKSPEVPTRLQGRANIHLLGERPHAEIPAYLRGAAVAMIPYRATALTENIFPLKLFEYLAAGAPVVVGGLPELRRLSGSIGVAEKPEDYPGLVRQALAEDGPEKRAERAALAAGNSWDARIEEISRLVEASLFSGPPAEKTAD
jgi:glycosyltransferase involved in cell wall biosynthesis